MSMVNAQLIDHCGFTVANILSCLDVYIVRMYDISKYFTHSTYESYILGYIFISICKINSHYISGV